jgi:iron(III) transport system ATP-binding protein
MSVEAPLEGATLSGADDVPTAMLEIRSLRKSFTAGENEASSRVLAVDDLSLTIEAGELFTLLGPSGCGKTTTLRCVAGLEYPDSGAIVVDGQTFFDSETSVRLHANRRGLGMVFQSYAIWPHMNVFENVAFPLRVKPRASRPGRAEVSSRVERALSVVQLEHLSGRQATDLSGGQQQRLALARALVMEPPLLLLDEPLSNLDAKLREQMRFELKRLQRELNITTIYVTHDQVEALAMSDRIGVMNGGRFEQIGPPREVYQRPASKFVADFIGTSNLIDGRVVGQDADGYLVETPAGRLQVNSDLTLPNGAEVIVAVRPEHVLIEPAPPELDAVGRWSGVVRARAFLGEAVDHVVEVGFVRLRVRSHPSQSLADGTEVSVRIANDCTWLISAASV